MRISLEKMKSTQSPTTIHVHEQVGDAHSEFNSVEPELLPLPRLSLKKRSYTGERRRDLSMPPQVTARSITPDLFLPLFDEDSADAKHQETIPVVQDDCIGHVVPPSCLRPDTLASLSLPSNPIDNAYRSTSSSARQDDGDIGDICIDQIDPAEIRPKKLRTRESMKSHLSPVSFAFSLVSDGSTTLSLSHPQSQSLDDSIEELNGRFSSIAPLSTALETVHSFTRVATPSSAVTTACNISSRVTIYKQFATNIVAPIRTTDDPTGGEYRSTSNGTTKLSSIPPISRFFEDDVTPQKSAFSFRMRPRKHSIVPKDPQHHRFEEQ